MKRASLWSEDSWRDRPWPKDRPALGQGGNPRNWAFGDIRIWLAFLLFFLVQSSWDAAAGHYRSAVLPTFLAIEFAFLAWVRRREVAALWRRRS